ncbi:MAG: polysaccharide deacetylase family protein [Candidatus Zixiibacteriota bacterium]|nr:MAG: polysaccharide deacetylase family protein [candidate division Zixibacteria bacterium]
MTTKAAVPKILVFHKSQFRFSYSSTNFSPRRLAKLLAYLTQEDYSLASVDDVLADPHANRIGLTFDDGYDHLRERLPALMENYAITPTVFVPTAYIGQPNKWDYSYVFQTCCHLDLTSIRELADLGVEFGSHSHSHRPLIRLSGRKLCDELETSRKILEDITSRPVTKISYPFGSFNRAVVQAAGEAGYLNGFTMHFPTSADNPLAIGRLPVYGFDTLFSMRQKISGGPLYSVEKMKAGLTNRLSRGTGIYRWFTGR